MMMSDMVSLLAESGMVRDQDCDRFPPQGAFGPKFWDSGAGQLVYGSCEGIGRLVSGRCVTRVHCGVRGSGNVCS
eukprot:2596135-Amphidinium_carterae.1